MNLALFSIVSIVSFVLGFYVSIFIAKHVPFHYSETINIIVNPLSIFSIIITVVLAYYVTRVLAQQNEKDNQERLLLIEYFKDFNVQFSVKIGKILNQSEFNASLNASEFKFLRKKLYSLIKLARQQKFADEHISSKLQQKLTYIWKLLTDESHYNKQGIKQEHKSAVHTHMIKIDELIFKIIVEINRARGKK